MENLTLENLRANTERVINEFNTIRNFCEKNSVLLRIRSKNQFSSISIHETDYDLYIDKLQQVTKKEL